MAWRADKPYQRVCDDPTRQYLIHWMYSIVCWMLGAFLLVGCLGPQTQATTTTTSVLESELPARQVYAHHPHSVSSQAPAQSLPIKPFPALLDDQISVLQAHDRFFYGGSANLHEVALTFDDGPNPPYTDQVLAILKGYGIHATFFCVGSQVAVFPDMVRQELAQGHLIGNHSWSHPLLTKLPPAEITSELARTNDILQQTTGHRPMFFRPPYGSVNAKVLTQVNQLALTTVIWSDGSLDWTYISPKAIMNQVLSTAGNGAIILMHDGGGNRSRTIAALPSIIEGLQARNYRFVTLEQLVADGHKKSA